MKYKDRYGRLMEDDLRQEALVRFLYGTYLGEKGLRVLTRKFISNLAGNFLSTRLSKPLIPPFVRKNKINPKDFIMNGHQSFNDFFIRKLREGARPIDLRPKSLISPCDSKITAYVIDELESKFTIKNMTYTFEELTRSKKLAEVFKGGTLLVFRLAVDDYHRYCYVDNGDKSQNYRIKGAYHTVNPAACEKLPVYKENERVISMLKSENFGLVMMMEVGAMMVGKIVNYDGPMYVEKGMEKGRFEFGGSTVILAFTKDAVEIDRDILINSQQGIETKVKYGEQIGRRYL